MRRMQVHDRAGAGALLVHHPVQKALLGRRVAGNEPPVMVEPRQPRRVEAAERGVGRGHQPALAAPQADVAGGAGGQAAVEDRGADRADRLALPGVAHFGSPSERTAKARKEKVGRAEIAGFEREGQSRLVEARGPRHAGVDLRADAQASDAERLNNGARSLAAGDDEAPDARRGKTAGDRRQRLLDQVRRPARGRAGAVPRRPLRAARSPRSGSARRRDAAGPSRGLPPPRRGPRRWRSGRP